MQSSSVSLFKEIAMPISVTLDTNCFFDYFERDPKYIKELIDYSEEGSVDIYMTTRVMADTHDKWKGSGTSPIWINIQQFPQLSEIVGTVFRLNSSRLGSGDYLVSEKGAKTINALEYLMVGAPIEDVDHLFGHIKSGHDLFITNDKHFLNYKGDLKTEYDVVVLTPEDAIKEIKRKLND